MDEVCDRKPSEEDLLGCWEVTSNPRKLFATKIDNGFSFADISLDNECFQIVSCKLQEERYPDVEG